MALRLAGEDYNVVQGLDGIGWLRDITVSSSAPALKVDQKGSGSILDLLHSGTPVLRVLNGGNLAFLVGNALTAGQYEIGRNSDATNRLQYNVPSGAMHEFSINDVHVLEIQAGKVLVTNNTPLEAEHHVRFMANAGITGSLYEIGRGSSGHLWYNTPTAYKHRFAVNGAALVDIGNLGNSVYLDCTANVNAGSYQSRPNADAVLAARDNNRDALVRGVGTGSSKLQVNGGGATGVQAKWSGTAVQVGLYGVTPVARASKINDPSGGATIDSEARAAINAVVDALEGIGITAAV